ncbi:GNAT family N-acetyltransferase [Pigmentiphaga aceris]|uniref:GNAT family N-acetyltransferase n=1 Tax=Pigmentiphaga aceris TaxID=1940612 RepID=A0A5C0ASS4_9BURK|nr:GNAT family N-acetyltransferase [Pigmentiphaga aceris]QEI05288.1 GNAT family N-acetyltransferase [Pigmentiphaga aceris]
MRVRQLATNDAAAFQALRLAGLRDHPENFGASYEAERQQSLDAVATRLTPGPDRAVFGAEIDGVLVGVIGVYREAGLKQAHKGGIWGMYVDANYRGKGIAAALLQRVLSFATERDGWRQIRLSANAANTAAIRLYASHGFVQYGVERGALLVDGVLHDEVLMQYDLPMPTLDKA